MNSEENGSLDEMSSEFVAEIKDDLASLEPDLLVMEEKGAQVDDALINHAFRSIHSIKGGAGFINFTALSGLSHAMENVLMRVREKKLVITSDIVDALLAGFDRMKEMVENFGSNQDLDCENEVSALEKILTPETAEDKKRAQAAKTRKTRSDTARKTEKKSGRAAASSRQKARPEEKEAEGKTALENDPAIQWIKPISDSGRFKDKSFKVDKVRFERALESQKFVYAVLFRPEKGKPANKEGKKSLTDVIKSIGEILYSELDGPSEKTDSDAFYCIVATILDLPLLSQVLEVNKTQISLVGRKGRPSGEEKEASPVPWPPPDPSPGLMPQLSANDPSLSEPENRTDHRADKMLPNAGTSPTIRVSVDLVSKLMNRAGELVLSRNRLRSVMDTLSNEQRQAANVMQNLDMVTTDIQETIMQMRMQPIGDLMAKYKRVVRDIARRMSKKVEFALEGAQVEIDRNVLEKLANPLTHLIRNCIDHGIESPEKRTAAGKPETGTIHVKAYHQGGYVNIIISDDGAGIDPQLILSKAFEKGLISENQITAMTDKQKIELIFLPGFSTSEEITDISGRGVGMDVVKTNIERLRGRIEIDSVQGQGTIVRLVIPLTLAIVPSLIIGAGDARFAIPQVNIKEVIYLEADQIHDQVEKIAGSEVLKLREELIPVLRLRNVLQMKTYVKDPETGSAVEEKRKAIADRREQNEMTAQSEKRQSANDRRKNPWDATFVIILKLGQHRFGLCVDQLFDIEEVVVEPLSRYIKHLKCFAGTSILGDGQVIMILDIPGIASYTSLDFDTLQARKAQSPWEISDASDQEEVRNLIVFGNENNEYFALSLDSIFRLEPIRAKDLHMTGDRKYLEYQGHAVMLFTMDEFIPASSCDPKDELFIIFPKHINARAGIMASVIVDTIDTSQELSRDAASPDLVQGKFFMDDRMIQVLDHKLFFEQIEKRASEMQKEL